jgi:ribonuclease HII
MGILIGMDEAGYGPNLGPLVVAATAWEVKDGAEGRGQGAGSRKQIAANGSVSLATAATPNVAEHDLYRALRAVVSRTASERKIAIADSKALYKPGLGLRQLERGVHAVLAAMQHTLTCWAELVDHCAADPAGCHARLCWHDGFNCGLPIDAADDDLARLGERLARACDAAGIRPLAIRARLVFPAEFNELCEYHGNKAAALSHVTIGLLREVVEVARTECSVPSTQVPVSAVCDKHGGRNFYAALLQHHFPEHWITPVFETHTESRYEWGNDDERMQVSFTMQGERYLPTALASMTAKYLRQLSMRAFNEFWCAKVPGLRPTAGYPSDAPRFKRAIDAVQRELGVDDHVLWRKR